MCIKNKKIQHTNNKTQFGPIFRVKTSTHNASKRHRVPNTHTLATSHIAQI